MLLDAVGGQHHTAVMTRIPRDGTVDGENHLHPLDAKLSHLDDALVLY